MKARIALFTLVVLAPMCSVQAHPFGFTVSASLYDPYVNSAEAAMGPTTFYVWLACMEAGWCFLGGGEFSLVATGIEIVSVGQGWGCMPIWIPPDFLLGCGCCPGAPSLVGSLNVLDYGGTICFEPSSSGALGAVGGPYPECVISPSLWPADWIGIDTTGKETACGGIPPLCQDPVAQEDSSWGRIKGTYR